jgi:hypothetical protein
MLVAFRAKPIEGICGNCELWENHFNYVGRCKINGNLNGYAHRCDVEEDQQIKNLKEFDLGDERKRILGGWRGLKLRWKL